MRSAAARAPHGPGAFVRDGYAVMKAFLRAGEVSRLRVDVERLLLAARGAVCERPDNTLVPLRWDDVIVGRVLASESRCRRLGEIVDAEDLRWISGYLSLKEARSPALWWHQDWWCWDHPVSFASRAPQIAVLCYLTSTERRNAALRVLPGSHHASTALHAALPEAHAQQAGDLSSSHPAMSDHPRQVTLRLEAGDAVVIDYRLLHGTHANATDVRRDGLLLSFAPSWDALPADIKGHLIRHPALPSDDEDPHADPWKRRLLPRSRTPGRDLPLNRVAPRDFTIVASP